MNNFEQIKNSIINFLYELFLVQNISVQSLEISNNYKELYNCLFNSLFTFCFCFDIDNDKKEMHSYFELFDKLILIDNKTFLEYSHGSENTYNLNYLIYYLICVSNQNNSELTDKLINLYNYISLSKYDNEHQKKQHSYFIKNVFDLYCSYVDEN